MATINRFSDLPLWKLARQTNINLMPLFKALSQQKDYVLLRQMQRSAGSVMDNIAEGFERGGNKELVQFLAIARGSAGELNSQLYRTYDYGYIGEADFLALNTQCEELQNRISGFMRYLSTSEMKGIKFRQRS